MSRRPVERTGSIEADKYVEVRRREGEQLAILERRPPHLPRGLYFVGCKLAAEWPVDALVEQHPHETVSISRSFASSRKTITCSRVTDGNPSRKSSIVSPASM